MYSFNDTEQLSNQILSLDPVDVLYLNFPYVFDIEFKFIKICYSSQIFIK